MPAYSSNTGERDPGPGTTAEAFAAPDRQAQKSPITHTGNNTLLFRETFCHILKNCGKLFQLE